METKQQLFYAIKDICCEKIKKCEKAPCFLCKKECNEQKIVEIINKNKTVIDDKNL